MNDSANNDKTFKKYNFNLCSAEPMFMYFSIAIISVLSFFGKPINQVSVSMILWSGIAGNYFVRYKNSKSTGRLVVFCLFAALWIISLVMQIVGC